MNVLLGRCTVVILVPVLTGTCSSKRINLLHTVSKLFDLDRCGAGRSLMIIGVASRLKAINPFVLIRLLETHWHSNTFLGVSLSDSQLVALMPVLLVVFLHHFISFVEYNYETWQP